MKGGQVSDVGLLGAKVWQDNVTEVGRQSVVVAQHEDIVAGGQRKRLVPVIRDRDRRRLPVIDDASIRQRVDVAPVALVGCIVRDDNLDILVRLREDRCDRVLQQREPVLRGD
jgi:hypothetical protein